MAPSPPASDPRANDPRSEASKRLDLISRGDHTPSPIGRSLFILLRTLDPFLQYSILAQGTGTALLHRIGLRTLPAGLAARTGLPFIDALGLSPYRLVLLGMAIGSATKQSVWLSAISNETMSVKNALIVCAFNTIVNSLNSYLFIVEATSASTGSTFPQPQLMVGATLYILGIAIEFWSEVQRKRFKDDPANKGRPYTGGLWSWARHINYGAYTFWRTGYAVAAGGYIYGGLVGLFFFHNFVTRGVPVLDEYCAKRYGEDWEKFKRQTRWRLIPGIY